MKTYPIVPVGKPRMTRNGIYNKGRIKPAIARYNRFKDEVRLRRVQLRTSGAHVTFVLPMPASWSKKRRADLDGKPHQAKPDIDNLQKALLDALFEDDSGVWDLRATKVWGDEGAIIIADPGTGDDPDYWPNMGRRMTGDLKC